MLISEWENKYKRAIEFFENGKYHDALKSSLESLSIAKKNPDEFDSIALNMNLVGKIFKYIGDYDQSEKYLKNALEIFEKKLLKKEINKADVISNLAELYRLQEKYILSEQFNIFSLEIREKYLGSEHLDVATSLNNLAQLYQDQEDYLKAEPLYLRSLDIRKNLLGSEHPDVATTMNNLARLYLNLDGKYPEAERLFLRSLEIREKVLDFEHPDLATSLHNRAWLYNNQGLYAEAESFFLRSLKISEKTLGQDHPDVEITLHNLAHLYEEQGNHSKAEKLYLRVLEIREKALGPEHQGVARILNSLAKLYRSQALYAQAELLFLRALEINEKKFGTEHLSVAMNLNDLALLYQDQSLFAQASPLFLRSLEIYENALGPEHPSVVTVLNNLAALYLEQGLYSQAEPLYLRSLETREKILGPEHPDVATSLNNLAVVYVDQGLYSQAEPLYLRSLKIREKVQRPEHPDVATSLNNLAVLYFNQGLYFQAEPLYLRSLEIRENILGPEHPDVATSLDNLALLYSDQGLYSQAEPLYFRSLEIREKALGPEHPDVATSLNNLAVLYLDQGLYSQAEPLYLRSLEIREKILGPEHPDVATTLNNLAGLYLEQGLYSQAEPLYLRSLEIREKILGPEHPYVATSLNNLAALYLEQGHYSQAEPLYLRSLVIREKILGPEHPDVATFLTNLARLYVIQGRYSQARQLYLKALKIDEQFVSQLAEIRTESETFLLLIATKYNPMVFLNLTNQYLRNDLSAYGDSLDVWLRRKGLALEVQRQFQEALVYSEDPQVYQTIQEFNQIRIRLTHMIFSGPGHLDAKTYMQRVAELEQEKDDLEVRLIQLSQVHAERKKVKRADRFQVAAALPKDTTLIDFARIAEYDYKAERGQRWLPDRYLAFILPAGKPDNVELIDLGPAESIDEAVAAFRALAQKKDADQDETGETSRGLYHLVFKPLQAGLGDIREVFISPDGNLNLLPFEVLQDDQGRFLIEDYTFNYLSTGREILGFGPNLEQSGKPLFMGDPDFDLAVDPGLKGNDGQEDEENDDLRSVAMEMRVFRSLPGTRQEIAEVSQIVGREDSVVLTGAEATEEALFAHRNPAILHLATHGFFREDKPLKPIDQTDTLADMRSFTFISGEQFHAPATFIMSENPLLRSGLVLAGANRAIRGETDAGRGIVTAEKILNLRLWGTDLVVLSACDTGMGDIRTGEGVFGLRRAFNQVGAKSLVMSMWKVPDRETRELMVAFYRNVFDEGLNYNQALRQAALAQLELTRERHGHANPFYWGGFIFSGDPR